MKWNTVGPRISGVFDVSGDGKTAAKASAGRYYYVLSTGGGGVSNVNPNANYSELYTWNDVNGDRKFQIGEQTGTPVITSVINPATGEILTSIDPDFSRPYTDEFSVGVDRELMPSVKLSAVVHLPAGKEHAGVREPRQPVRDDADERRRSGARRLRRHRRRWHVRVLPAALGGESHAHHQRSERAAELQGARDHRHQAVQQPLADAGGLHAIEESDRGRQRRRVAELPDQHGRQHQSRTRPWAHRRAAAAAAAPRTPTSRTSSS